MDRRRFLNAALGAACSAAASPALSTMSFAATPGDRRLVTIVLRGAMDGLDVVQPYGDPALRKLRRSLSLGPGRGRWIWTGFTRCTRPSPRFCRCGPPESWALRRQFRRPIATNAAISTARTSWRPEPPRRPAWARRSGAG